MTKTNELADALFEWAEEDADNRSVMLIAGDEESVRKTYHGCRGNLVESLAEAMIADKELRSVCASALFKYETDKANNYDKE